MDQNEDATVPHISERGSVRQSALTEHFTTIQAWLFISLVILSFNTQVTVLLLPWLCFSFPTHCSKGVLTKKPPQHLSGAAWLLLPWSGALLRKAASFLFRLRLPGPQSCVSQLQRVNFVFWPTGRVKQPPDRRRRYMCVNVLVKSPGCLDGNSSWPTLMLQCAN